MKVTSKGQVTIPQPLRERFGLAPHSEVEFSPTKDGVLIKPAQSTRDRMRAWIEQARGSNTTKLTANQIMKMTRGEG